MADEKQPPKRTPIPLVASPEKKALARKLAGLPPIPEQPAAAPETTDTPVAAVRPVVQPLRERPEDHVDWWRNEVGALLLVSEAAGAPVEVRLEAVSPNGDFIRVRPTSGAFMWRPRHAVKLLDVIAYPADAPDFERGVKEVYGLDLQTLEAQIDARISAHLAALGILPQE